jgi:serine/threonine protein kinase
MRTILVVSFFIIECKRGNRLKIGDYQIEKSLTTNQDISFFIVSDSDKKTFMLRKLNRKYSELTSNAWFQCYEAYQLNITNFKYIPKALVIRADENEVYTMFPHENGTLLSEVRKLSLNQVEQLIEAVRHLHKKGFVHGSIDENNIWIRENGDLQLFGAGEKKVLSPSAQLNKQEDYQLIFSIIKRFTNIKVKDGQVPNTLEGLLDLIQTSQINSGLVEKEIESNIVNRAGVPELLADSNDDKKESNSKSAKKSKWWLIWFGFVLLLVGFVTFIVNLDHSPIQTTKAENNPTKIETEKVESKPPEIDLQQFSALFPNWQFVKQENVKISDSYYTILGIGREATDDEIMGKAKVAVLHYNAETNEWSKVWETEEYECDSTEVESYLEMLTLNPHEQKTALLVFGTNQYRSGYETYAVEVNGEGKGKVVWQGNGDNLVKKGDFIHVYDLGETQITLTNNKIKVKSIGRSEVAPENAVKAHFTLNQDGFVVPTKSRTITVKVGQVLSFIPDNDESKRLFDEGEIMLFTNMGNSGPVGTSNSESISGGNAIEFTEEGTFEFLLDYYDEQTGNNLDNPQPTFIVYVGDTNSIEADGQ